MQNIRYFLFALTIATLCPTPLAAMKRKSSCPESPEQTNRQKNNPQPEIAQELPATIQEFPKLIPEFIAKLKTIPLQAMDKYFIALDKESRYKMALRLVCAQAHKKNLDKLDCVYFIENIDNWINGCSDKTTEVLRQEYLPYVLPLLEAIIGKPVTTLDLSKPSNANPKNKLAWLPPEIYYLSNLIQLYIYGNNIMSLPPILNELTHLNSIWADAHVIVPDILRKKGLVICPI